MNPNKKIAIIEQGGSHDECLYPQLLFLRDAGYEIHLIMRKNQLERIQPLPEVNTFLALEPIKNKYQRIRNLKEIKKHLIINEIKDVILNTAQGAFIRDLTIFLPHNVRITGISHNPKKLIGSFNQRIINRKVKKYFVLNDYIVETLKDKKLKLKIKSFYPVFFRHEISRQPSPGLNVIIPGAVDPGRRDYESLIEEMHAVDLSDDIKIFFLGRCEKKEARALRKKLSEKYGSKRFIFYDQFVPDKEFFRLFSQADLILPLLTPRVPKFNLYRKYKVTGGINLSFGLKIPLVLHDDLSSITDFALSSFYYKDGDLISTLNYLSKNKELIEELSEKISENPKFGYEFQRSGYLRFIEA